MYMYFLFRKFALFIFLLFCIFGFTQQTFALASSDVTIVTLQNFLESKGFLIWPEGDKKGNFGPKTKQALIAYQLSVNLPAQGIFGTLTKSKITEELSNTPPDSSKENLGGFTSTTNTSGTNSQKLVTQAELYQNLQELKNSMLSAMSKVSAAPSAQPVYNYAQIALGNRIDQLTNTTINTPTITGGSIINPNISGGSMSGITLLGLQQFNTGASTTQLTATGSVYLATLGGNVGIGTTSPGYKLDVVGSINIPNSTDSTTGILFKNGSRFLHNFAPSGTDGQNVFLGLNAGNFTMSGVSSQASYNTGVGSLSLQSLTNGVQNSALGYGALKSNTTGIDNTANGYTALFSNTIGRYNTAQGAYALNSNRDGFTNTAVGFSALYLNVSGYDNTAVGSDALFANTGSSNTAVGRIALTSNTTGSNNTALGFSALDSTRTGDENTAVGYQALEASLNTSGNTALGFQAGYGDSNVQNMHSKNDTGMLFLGYQASRDGSVPQDTVLSKSVAIGYNARVATSSAIVLGGTGADVVKVGIGTTSPWRTLSVTGTVGLDGLSTGAGAGSLCLSANKEILYSAGAGCTVSSGRFKHDIATSTAGLSVVNSLRPVTFQYNTDIGVPGEQFGFIAEEVEKIDPRLVVHDASSTPFSVRYENFTAVLARAIQELSSTVTDMSKYFVDGVLHITGVVTDKVTTKELCVEDVCVTKDQFKAMVGSQAIQSSSPSSSPVQPSVIDNSGTTTPIATTTSDTISTTTADTTNSSTPSTIN